MSAPARLGGAAPAMPGWSFLRAGKSLGCRATLARLHRALVLSAALGTAVLGPAGSASAGDAAAGREKAEMCQSCHGIDGVAKVPDAPNIASDSELYIINQLNAFRTEQR